MTDTENEPVEPVDPLDDWDACADEEPQPWAKALPGDDDDA
jgi:hypothetical protein